MPATKNQIDAAIVAYQTARKPNGGTLNHLNALGDALRIVRPFSTPELATANAAYSRNRSPDRWDGIPWGECGTNNHRNGITAALNTLIHPLTGRADHLAAIEATRESLARILRAAVAGEVSVEDATLEMNESIDYLMNS